MHPLTTRGWIASSFSFYIKPQTQPSLEPSIHAHTSNALEVHKQTYVPLQGKRVGARSFLVTSGYQGARREKGLPYQEGREGQLLI